MIPRSGDWKNALAQAVRDPAELLTLLELPERWLQPARRAAETFPLRVPRGYVARMVSGNPDDPLLRQVLPLREELEPAPGFVADPVGDRAAAAAPGLLHKYHGRVLMTLTGACAVHCRYCFRRHFPYAEENPRADGWSAALDYIAGQPEVTEVVLSGGDPLAMDDAPLSALAEKLAAIRHVRRLRVHTRLPVVLPERVTDELLGWLTGTRLDPVMVIHANHSAEIDTVAAGALRRLRGAGVPLFNQAVLLRGVNDNVTALIELSERLFAADVIPYYLHLLDPVAGAAHFDVSEEKATALVEAARQRLPGYLVPQLVRERAGAASKLPVF